FSALQNSLFNKNNLKFHLDLSPLDFVTKSIRQLASSVKQQLFYNVQLSLKQNIIILDGYLINRK
ncbi:hypothetical protein P7D79_21965, partial [Enterococcus avium]